MTVHVARKAAVMAALKVEMKDVAKVAVDEVAVVAAAVVVTARAHVNDWMLKASRLLRTRVACNKPATRARMATALIARHATTTVDVAVNAPKTVNGQNAAHAQSVAVVIALKMANALNGRIAATAMSAAKRGMTVLPKHAPSATTSHARKAVKVVKVVPSAEVATAAARIALPARTTAAPMRQAHQKSIA